MSTPSLAENTFCTALPNGMKIFVCPRPGSGTVFTQAVIRTGSIHEGEFLGCGLSHFLEHMVFSGTETHPGHTDIADRVNALGGSLNASTGYNSTQYYIEVPPAAVKEALDMLYGMIARPLFPEERFQHEKNVILRESAMRNDSPYTLLHETLLKTAFSRYPARVPIIGYPEKIKEVDRDRMKAYYDLRYSPVRTAFVVAGDVEVQEVVDHLAGLASGWRLGRIDEPVIPAEPDQTSPQIENTFYNDPLAWIALAYREPNRTQQDRTVQEVFSRILTGSESARLIRELVTQQQVADEIIASRFQAQETALSTICAVAAPENAQKTIDGIRNVLDALKREPVKRNELDRIATGIERGFWDIFRSNRGLGRIISSRFADNKPLAELDRYPEMIRAVTAEQIMEVAEKYHDRACESLVCQMPEEYRRKNALKQSERKNALKAERTELTGGQRLVTVTDDSLPLIHVAFCLPGGTTHETPETAGATELIASILPCGTAKYSEDEFNTLLDDNAIDLSVENCVYYLRINASCMVQQLPLLKDLLKSMLAEPAFAPDVFEREKATYMRDLESNLTDPRTVAKMLTRSAIFPDHSLGISEEQILKNLAVITRETTLDCYRKLFSPTQTVASVAGAISHKDAEAMINEIFQAIHWSSGQIENIRADHSGKSGIQTITRELDKAQSVVMYGLPAAPCGECGLGKSLVILASNGMSARLFKTVREERGLAYYTALSPIITDSASFVTYLAGTKPGAEKEVLTLFEEERKLRAEQGFTQEEFDAAVAKMWFDIADRIQDAGKLAGNCMVDEYRGKGAAYLWQVMENLKKFTLEDMNRATKTLLEQPFRVMTAVSPEKFSDFPEFSI